VGESEQIAAITPDPYDVIGMDLSPVVGRHLTELVAHMRSAFGDLESSTIAYHDGGIEERTMRFAEGGRQTEVRAVLGPAMLEDVDVVASWHLAARTEDRSEAADTSHRSISRRATDSSWNAVGDVRSAEHLPRVLVNRGLDTRLRRDGFVTFKAIDARAVESLRASYGQLHGWKGEGFEPDLTNPDVDYRTAVSAAIAKVLDETVGRRFVCHVPFLRNFLCKWPGPESELYLHQDWSYIDERKGERSYVLWFPLSDVRGHEGQLRVLRGSHRIERSLRGSNLTGGWWEFVQAIRPRLESVPVRAGDCVVMDNGLLHCSYPNNSGEPRLVAAVAVRPASQPLVHFRRADSDTLHRFDVDDAFFLAVTPSALHEAPPPLQPAEIISASPVGWDESEFLYRLDRATRRRLRSRLRDRVMGLPEPSRGASSVY
jgi:hypothetical protein